MHAWNFGCSYTYLSCPLLQIATKSYLLQVSHNIPNLRMEYFIVNWTLMSTFVFLIILCLMVFMERNFNLNLPLDSLEIPYVFKKGGTFITMKFWG